jgi:hypothetical protein
LGATGNSEGGFSSKRNILLGQELHSCETIHVPVGTLESAGGSWKGDASNFGSLDDRIEYIADRQIQALSRLSPMFKDREKKYRSHDPVLEGPPSSRSAKDERQTFVPRTAQNSPID